MNVHCRTVVMLGVLAAVGCKKPAPASDSAASSGAAAPAASAAAPSLSGSLAMLEGFEGEVALHAKGKASSKDPAAKDVSFALQVKDGKFRVDVPQGLSDSHELDGAFALVKPAEKKLFVVMVAKKQAVLLDFDKLATQVKDMSTRMHPSGGAGKPPESPPVVEKTGKSDTVAGYRCEVWHIADAKSKSTVDLCIAQEGASWFHIPLLGVPAEYAWASEILDGHHFPLRAVINENGAEQGRLEVTKIEKKSLPAASFEVPAGINVMDLDQMMGAMMGGMRPGMMPPGMRPGMMPPGMPPGMMPPGQPPSKHK